MTGARNFLSKSWIAAALAGMLAMAGVVYLVVIHRRAALPYRDSFANNNEEEWTSLGGTWEVNDRAVYNRSDERGAKLVSGSPSWANYELNTDLKLIGHEGDVGVIVRLSEEERGIDSYRGYYVGLRSEDSALVVGRADHGWMEGQPIPMLGGVQIGVWYHLRVVVFGCQIGAEATNIESKQTSWAAFRDQSCFRKGKIGLRSMATGGAWRNVSVSSTSQAALQTVLAHAAFVTEPSLPGREADYSRMRASYFKDTYIPARSYQDSENTSRADKSAQPEMSPIVNIDSARSPTPYAEPVTIRGVVTLASPLFVQDSTGSIAVDNLKPIELNLGDEVEISGKTIVSGFTPKFAAGNVHLLWDRTLIVPVSITSTQAASGVFDASLVELRGTLASKSIRPDHVITLHLYDSAQTFSAVLHGGLSMKAYENWAPGSILSVRGICTVPAASSDAGTAFEVLLRATDDVQVLAGPPWWSGKQLVRLLFLMLLLVFCGVYLYLRLERWKMNTIVSERERLAHEMHDTLAQSFAGIGFHLQGLYNGMRLGHTKQTQAVAMLRVACDMVTHSHLEASASIAALHPDEGAEQDFLVALDRSTREMLHSSNGAQLPLILVREGVAQALSMPVRDALFHIGREAIANMLRHAQATQMELKLRYEPKYVVLEMHDNGIGFIAGQQSEGFGILGMRSRCARIGAQMEILSEAGEGTRIIVKAPYGHRPRLAEWIWSLWRRPRGR